MLFLSHHLNLSHTTLISYAFHSIISQIEAREDRKDREDRKAREVSVSIISVDNKQSQKEVRRSSLY